MRRLRPCLPGRRDPRGAPRIGTLREGDSGGVLFLEGELNVGEAMSPPAIRAVKRFAPPADFVLLDAPPGTSCPVVETVRGCDLVVLVTEPTPFGLYDLSLAVSMVRALELPIGVVINRAGVGDGKVRIYCENHGLQILAEIPDDRRVAEAYSRGEMIVETVPGFEAAIRQLHDRILAVVKAQATNVVVPCKTGPSHGRPSP